MSTPPRITLLTRAACHLCGYAREAVARVHAATGAGWWEVDVAGDPDLEAEYGDRVPVVLVDGTEHDYFRVDEARLRHALTSPPGSSGAPGSRSRFVHRFTTTYPVSGGAAQTG